MVNSSSELPNQSGASDETPKDQTSTEAIFSRLNEERTKLDELFTMSEEEAESMDVDEFEDRIDALEATPAYQEQLRRVNEAEKAARKRFIEDPDTAVVQIKDPEELKQYLYTYDRHLSYEGMSKPERQQKALPLVERFDTKADKHFREMLAQEGLIAYTQPFGKRILQATLQRIRGASAPITPKGPVTPK